MRKNDQYEKEPRREAIGEEQRETAQHMVVDFFDTLRTGVRIDDAAAALSERLYVHRTTIYRWRRGDSFPQRSVVPSVLRVIRQLSRTFCDKPLT